MGVADFEGVDVPSGADKMGEDGGIISRTDFHLERGFNFLRCDDSESAGMCARLAPPVMRPTQSAFPHK